MDMCYHFCMRTIVQCLPINFQNLISNLKICFVSWRTWKILKLQYFATCHLKSFTIKFDSFVISFHQDDHISTQVHHLAVLRLVLLSGHLCLSQCDHVANDIIDMTICKDL